MKNNFEANKNNIISTGKEARSMEVFAAAVKNRVESCLGDGYHVLIQDVSKNNGIVRTGICIKGEGERVAPNIYLDGYFSEYQQGRTVESICSDILRVYGQERQHMDFNVASVMDFQHVKSRICFKLVNAERNEGLLADMPHLFFHDLAVVFYILLEEDFKCGLPTIAIKKGIMDMWAVDIQTLYEVALWNTQRLLGSSVISLSEVMEGMAGECGIDTSVPVPLYIATNKQNLNGAAVLLYRGILERFADKAGDFYILPSSIHEVLFLPCNEGVEPEEIQDVVHIVNSSEILPEEFLSDNIYRYNKAKGRVEII